MSDPIESNEEELQILLGQAIARRPWPPIGTVVTIGYDWDGKETYQNEAYLSLKAGDKVRVEECSAQGGILFGSVIGGRNQAKGWFGGSGCEATLQVSVPVPLGADTGEVPPDAGDRAGNGDYGDHGDAVKKDVDVGDVFIAVEEYLSRHQVDETASEKLRDLEPEVQAEIIKSDITNSRNPSAVLLSRIERVLKGGTSAPVPKGKSKGDAKGKGSPKGATVRATPRARSRSPRRPADRYDDRGKGGGKDNRNYDRGGGGGFEDVEDFIYKLNLDGKCADELRALPYPEQMQIVKVDLTNARNPSAVVYSRIQSVKGSETLRAAMDDYLYRNKIDEVAAKALEALPKDKQEVIISTDLSNSRNPSAVLLSRIRQIEAGQMPNSAGKFAPAGGGGGGPPPRSYSAPPEDRGGRRPDRREVEDYIRQHNLDDRVADEIRSLNSHELAQVLSSNITNARNPNAVVKTRIEAARQRSGLKDQVEDYIDKYTLDEVAARQLRDLAPDMQGRIIEQELSNCRNPSAVLLSRIRGMQKGTR